MSKDSSEADIICNRASLAHARSQRLISSWLPPRKQWEMPAAKTEEDLEREESEVFSPAPELLGLGALVSQHERDRSDRARGQTFHSDDKLRTRVLGKRVGTGSGKNIVGSVSLLKGNTKRKESDTHDEDEMDDAEGRTAIRRKVDKTSAASSAPKSRKAPPTQASTQNAAKVEPLLDDSKAAVKVPMSYLDEVLLARSLKRKKRKNKTTER